MSTQAIASSIGLVPLLCVVWFNVLTQSVGVICQHPHEVEEKERKKEREGEKETERERSQQGQQRRQKRARYPWVPQFSLSSSQIAIWASHIPDLRPKLRLVPIVEVLPRSTLL